MRRAALLALALLALSGCYRVLGGVEERLEGPPASGREAVLRELEPPRFFRKSSPILGILTTGLASAKYLGGLDADGGLDEHQVRFELRDGTVVGGLLFPWKGGDGPAPLLIASFGFLQDRFGTEAAKFLASYVDDPFQRVKASVLVLDHPTSGIFLGNNGMLSPGSYDDARMWIEIARDLREEMKPASVHLLGVSMSGQTVVHALIEDVRLGLGLFQSGIAISIAPDFARAPGRQLAQIDPGNGVENPWREIAGDATSSGDGLQVQAVKLLFEKQFLKGYRKVVPHGRDMEIPSSEIPLLFWNGFEDRLAFLREAAAPDWNPDFTRTDLPGHLADTRIADVVDRVRTPLVLLSARDDPAVLSEAFREVQAAAEGNPWVAAYETDGGGHFGFNVPYGAGYLGEIIGLMLDPGVLAGWRGARRPGS